MARGKSSPISLGLYERVAIRDSWMCHLCGFKVNPELVHPDLMAGEADHIIPRSKGGIAVASNLKLAHAACNQWRGDADAVEAARERKGWRPGSSHHQLWLRGLRPFRRFKRRS